ncbi:MAG: bifunctional hydroxymethylpyrimidine kinase/phosphomethylpyrimidine kinase [Bdellovibrionales bacterium]|nr:bifunctional hydroxymethylpyrimidine kinase/phosphomethylpyrimidine kinase [Bdellovibrionales bacterium]
MNRLETVKTTSKDLPRLKDLLARIGGVESLVVGDVGVDRYTLGVVERISPEAPVPIVAVETEWLKLGLAANVAENIVALGGKARMTGIVGSDRGAEDLAGLLKKAGVPSDDLVVDSTRRTVLKDRIVTDRQQMLRVDYESTHEAAPVVRAQVRSRAKARLASCRSVVIEDYAKGLFSREFLQELFDDSRAAGRVVLVDPNLKTPIDAYRGADVLTPNTKEAESLCGFRITDEASLLRAGTRLLEATGAEHVLITRGKDGIAIFTRGASVGQLVPTTVREVFDVSGAGDTVIAALALALPGGATIVEAAVLANLAAGVVVGKRGTATVTPAEIEQAMRYFFG